MPRPIVALLAVASGLVCFFWLFLGWQRGFSEGARQATNQILAEQTQTTELVQTRAQLDEQRRAEDSLTNMLLAAFTAGVTVLAVVNIGVFLASLQSFEREKEALRVVLNNDATKLDQELNKTWMEEISRRDQELRSRIGYEVAGLDARMAQMATSVDSLDRRIETVTAMTNSLFAENARREAVRLEKNQEFLSTAARYSNAFSFWAYAKRKSWGHLLLRRIITCLEKVQSAEDGSEALLDQIAANLQSADETPPPDADISTLVHEALARVEMVRTLDLQHSDFVPPPE